MSKNMGELVKLGSVRKQAARRAEAARGARNRLAFGRSKVERKLAKARADRAARELDGCKIDTGEDR
jgi:Domain of unknown function (DUF4169)